MHLRADSLDDLLRAIFGAILADGERVVPSKGPNRELFGVLLELKNPRARISRSETKGRLYSALGLLAGGLGGLAGSSITIAMQYYSILKERQLSKDSRLADSWADENVNPPVSTIRTRSGDLAA